MGSGPGSGDLRDEARHGSIAGQTGRVLRQLGTSVCRWMHREYAGWISAGSIADAPGARSVDDGVTLLAQELGHVVHRQRGLAGRTTALPAAERLDARPRAGRRARP